jgi:site-specific DNA-cytosine methylase
MQPTLWWTKSRRAQNVDDYETWISGGVVPTLNVFDNASETRATVLIIDEKNGGNVPMIKEKKEQTVRRLTPIECERLQGFPDDWTSGQADSNRYKQMGNAVAVPVVEWIVGRLVAQLDE